jgi:hypothetical protein
VSEPSPYEPFKFFEYAHRPGTYCLLLSDASMADVMDVFEECGYYGNGYGWTGVARAAIRTYAPEIADRVAYDPEAGLFVAYGDDPDALRRLGGMLRDAFHDHDTLAGLIAGGQPEWFD